MQAKKTRSRKSHTSNIQELLSTIEEQQDEAPSCDSFTLLDSTRVQTYFTNLHHMLTKSNLVQHQRLETLNDGIYILIKGQVSFTVTQWTQPAAPSLSKSCPSLTKSSFYSMPSLQSANCIINEPLFVFESQQKNCTALEDTTLLKIKEDQAVNAKFYQLFNRRQELYESQYLSCDHKAVLGRQLSGNVFMADLKVHSNFTFKTYGFRQIVCLQSDVIGIVAEGTAKLKHPLSKGHEFDKNGVMLPHLEYEVTSTLTLMLLKVNQTVSILVDTSEFEPGIEKQNEAKRPMMQPWGKKKTKRCRIDGTTIVYGQKKKERQRRERDLAKLSKDSEQYSIISSYLSRQNLNYAVGYNTRHNTREKRDRRVGKPEFLFSHYQSKHPTIVQSSQSTAQGSRKATVERPQVASKTVMLQKLRWPVELCDKWEKGTKGGKIRWEQECDEQNLPRLQYTQYLSGQ